MTELVGILNLTPDSFSDGGAFNDYDAALQRAQQLFDDGASLLDVGAESTRPGAEKLTHQAEWQRLSIILPELLNRYPGKISLDSYHPETIARALAIGPVIVNDVTGMNNPKMVAVVAEHQATCIISHLSGTDTAAVHTAELISDPQIIVDELLARADMLRAEGLERDLIILDPGIGFGKTPELNRQLLTFAELTPDYKVMIGYSRKRFLGDDRMELAPNLAAGRIAIASGAAYLRVHDVAGHRQLLY
jgi:dihydropteroate synthase